MASNALAAMLDELMGRDRNLAPTEKRSEPKWDDPEVCRYYLVDFCPHELFTNTRADLGPCEKIHDDHLRKEYHERYKKSSRVGRLGYEEDFLRYLQTLINDVEKRIRRGHQRLALNSMQGNLNGNPASQKEEKVKMLTERINDLVQKAEELGCEGKVEEAQGIMKLCDQLNEERTQLQNNPTPDPYNEPLKAMEVCTVCGALLVVGDAQQRVDEHIMGKQHSGYARIRAYVEGKRMKTKEEEEEKEAKLKQEREEREKEREKEREERRKKDEERKKEREEREKERERRKKRSRSRSRSRRSRSRDRKKRSRSRSRHRRRSRSRSRDRHHKSRRHRSRSRERSSRSEDKKRRSRSRDKSSKKSSRERSKSEDKQKESSRSEEIKVKTEQPCGDEDKAMETQVEIKEEIKTEPENEATDKEPGETN
ncbi:luc7-like protein 3 isoform X1 [Mercenaria mercenaria]|uniref:luc7-like protein 3 isoform X1 n=1 Tax=Mercenaria mercenaria TaxID=6596 RepID=UPI001E1D4250|nr:luc7-like protein 3 isoform X1 [Mercenaria mercenaria]